jgi:GGDEF domain-containing protein
MLAAAGALLVAAERLAEAESRPSVDECTGVVNRKLFLVLAARMLARLDRARGDGLAVLACQASSPAGGSSADAGPGALTGEAGRRPPPAPAATLARRLEGHLREDDLVGRFDDNTIVVACEGMGSPEDSLALARRLVTVLAPDPDAGRPDDAPSVHCGVVYTSVRVAPGVLLRRADTAAYQAAATGEGVALADL